MLNKLYQTVQLLTYSTVWFAEVLCHAEIEYDRHLSQYLRELEGPCSNFGSCLFGICIVNSSEGSVYHRDQKVLCTTGIKRSTALIILLYITVEK